MSDKLVRPFEPEDLAFFGAVTAGISHELKNVATIINESAGLLHDLSAGAESGRRPLNPLRIKKMSADIERNVQRLVRIMNRMNRFAHSVDELVQSADLTEVTLDTVALATRFASVRGVALETSDMGAAIPVQTYVFGLHRALYSALEHVVLDIEGVMPAQVSIERSSSEAFVLMHRGTWISSAEADERKESLKRVMTALGGR